MSRILVVDDERDVTVMLKFLLEKNGNTVETADDGRQALAALGLDPVDAAKEPPDLVILDVVMPGVDGYAVCDRMLEEPRTRDVPVLMLTAKSEMRELHRHAPNVAAQIDKPFDPASLRDLVTEMLDGAS